VFNEQELFFLGKVISEHISTAEQDLTGDVEGKERELLEKKLVIASSIRRKLENLKNSIKPAPKKSISILVIDDAEYVLEMHKEFLLAIGFKNVDTAKNGDIGLQKLTLAADKKQAYDLVVCDWEMPVMSGFDLLERVRADKKLCAVPFYLVTGRENKADIIKAISMGVTGYIIKPINPAILKEKLKEYITN